MTDERMNELFESIGIGEEDAQFQGAMPKGEVTCLGVVDETRKYENNAWVPVRFKSGADTYELSLKGLIRAEGLEYSTRNFRERGKMWLSGACNGKKFRWNGKEERKGIRKRDTASGKAGSEYTLNVYTFEKKKVG